MRPVTRTIRPSTLIVARRGISAGLNAASAAIPLQETASPPSHWGTPGVEGDIDVDEREALDLLEFYVTDPEERAISAEQEARISATKFLGPLIDATEPIVVDAFTTALFDRRSFEEGSQPTTVAEYNAMALRPTLTLDRILAQTWEGALALLRQELGIEAVDLNIDQQTRFTNGMILAILALLPERDLPVAS